MKATDLLKGKKARRPFPLRLGDEEITLEVRLLTGMERLSILECAEAAARARGVEQPKEGHPIYDFQVMVETVAVGVVDPDSPKDAPEPFFANANEVLSASELTPDHITYMYEQVQRYADDCGHRRSSLTDTDAIAKIVEIATTESDRPFDQLRPSGLVSLLRFSARLWWNSLTPKSPTTSGSASTSTSTSGAPDPVDPADEVQGP